MTDLWFDFMWRPRISSLKKDFSQKSHLKWNFPLSIFPNWCFLSNCKRRKCTNIIWSVALCEVLQYVFLSYFLLKMIWYNGHNDVYFLFHELLEHVSSNCFDLSKNICRTCIGNHYYFHVQLECVSSNLPFQSKHICTIGIHDY